MIGNDPVNFVDPSGLSWKSFRTRAINNFNITNKFFGINFMTIPGAISGAPPTSLIDIIIAGGLSFTREGKQLAALSATFALDSVPFAVQQANFVKFVRLGGITTIVGVISFWTGSFVGSLIEASLELLDKRIECN